MIDEAAISDTPHRANCSVILNSEVTVAFRLYTLVFF